MHRSRRPGRARGEGADRGLHRLRLHGGFAARGQPGADHDAAPAPEDRPQADRAHGRGHEQDRRPLGQGRDAPAPERRRDRRQHGRDQADLRAVPELRRRAHRRDHGRQRGLAGRPQLRRLPARVRPALLGQPDARLRLGQAAPRARASSELSGVQLHGAPGLRLPGIGAPVRLRAADGRLGPVGQHRQRHRSGPAARPEDAVRPDLAAYYHRLGRQDGQDRHGRRLAQPGAAVGLRLLAVLAQRRGRRRRPLPAPLHRASGGRDRALGSVEGRRDQRGQKTARRRGDQALSRAGRGRSGGRDRAPDLRGGRPGRRAADHRGAAGAARARNPGL